MVEGIKLDGECSFEVAGGVADTITERWCYDAAGLFGNFYSDVFSLYAVGAKGKVFTVGFHAA
jgi:hypothetical protein